MKKEDVRKKIREQVAKNSQLTEEQRALEIKTLEKLFIDGVFLQKAMGYSDQMMEFIYDQAYRLYTGGHYQKAVVYFFFLNELNPADLRFMNGYAACNMKLGKYEEAIVSYMYLNYCNISNPFYPYYLGILYQKLGKPNASYVNYARAVNLCGDMPELAELKERASLNLKALESQGVEA